MKVLAVDALTIVGFGVPMLWFLLLFGALVYAGWKWNFSGSRRKGK